MFADISIVLNPKLINDLMFKLQEAVFWLCKGMLLCILMYLKV